jgi:hypothetical protein
MTQQLAMLSLAVPTEDSLVGVRGKVVLWAPKAAAQKVAPALSVLSAEAGEAAVVAMGDQPGEVRATQLDRRSGIAPIRWNWQ